jgi:hypothetical protein
MLRHVPHRSSYKILCVTIAGVTVVNAALNIQHRLVFSLHPLFVRMLCIQVFILFLYFALFTFCYLLPSSSCMRISPPGFVLLNSNMLTLRTTPQHVGQVIFKFSIYLAFISRLCHPAEAPSPYPLTPMRKCVASPAGGRQLLVL